MGRSMALLLGIALIAPAVWGGELAGVEFADEVTVGAKNLNLNGMGLRKKSIIKVYVVGLYVEAPSQDSSAIVSSVGIKQVVMHFLTNKATKKKMDAAWHEGFKENSPSNYGVLSERVQTFADFFGDMKKDDVITLTISPDSGTAVALNGKATGTIDGGDFGRALLLVWLGDHPPAASVKDGLLGK